METKTRNHSRQRDAILAYLKPRHDHPTAETIYKAVRQEFPKLSLGTVYRNLTLLTELGVIQKVNCGDDCEHFDGNPQPHHHFICTTCKQVIDLHMDNIDFVNTLATQGFAGQIAGHSIYFYGTCEDCM